MSTDEFTAKNMVWMSLAGVVTILIGVNAFFIKDLVERVDGISEIKTRLSVLETKIDFLFTEAKKP